MARPDSRAHMEASALRKAEASLGMDEVTDVFSGQEAAS